MKRMLVLCLTPKCTNVLWSMEWDKENPEFTLIETTGGIDDCEFCEKCQEEMKKKTPPKFNNPKFGHTNVTAPNDFEAMMAKRKLENRKASGKGAGRANR